MDARTQTLEDRDLSYRMRTQAPQFPAEGWTVRHEHARIAPKGAVVTLLGISNQGDNGIVANVRLADGAKRAISLGALTPPGH